MIYDLVKGSELPVIENPDIERFIIANGDNLATAPLYFLLDKINNAMAQAAAANVSVNGIILNSQEAAQKARTAYDIAQSVNENVFDGEGYFDVTKIKPLSIETKLLSLGSRMQQFSLPGVNFYLENNFNSLRYTAGQIIHQTISDTGLRTWNIPAKTITIPSGFLHVYVKAEKTGTNAEIIATTAQINVDSDADFFHFEVGYISALTNGIRVIRTTYGFAQINPAELSIGRISDPTGTNYIDLKQNGIEIAAQVTFTAGSTGYNNLTDKPDLSSFEEARDYVNNLLQTELEDLKNRADGVIESWFYSHTPTLNNLPASNWTTNAIKDSHIGDTFTNMQEYVDNATTPDAGKAWRFAKNSDGSYSWNLIANSDSTKALIEAGKAKDTADAKRRVFVVQPSPPYDVGDLWAQGEGGELMRCVVTRLSGVFVASDWVKATKYTDDTAVNNLQIGGRNLVLNSAKAVSSSSYLVTSYTLSQPLTDGVYTIRIKGTFSSGDGPRPHIGWIGIEDQGQGTIQNGIYIKTFNYVTSFGNRTDLAIYRAVTDSNPMVIEWVKLEKGNKATDWTEAPEDVVALIKSEIADVEGKIGDLEDTVTGSFKDGIIEEAEARAIEKYINSLNAEKDDVFAKYNATHNDVNLIDKTPLQTAWGNYNTSHGNLIASINDAIDGGKTTAEEKADVDEKFEDYKNKLAALSTAFENAYKAIEQAKIDRVQLEAGNLIIKSKIKDGTYIVETNGLDDSYYSHQATDFIQVKAGKQYLFSAPLIHQLRVIFYNASKNYISGTLYSGNQGEAKSVTAPVGSAYVRISADGVNGSPLTKYRLSEDLVSALQAAQNAQVQRVIDLEGKTNFLTQSQASGNAMATGTLIVGNGQGANAGITGLGDPNSVRFWAGANFQNRETAPWRVHENGMMRGNHQSGNKPLAFEWGVDASGTPVVDFYHKDGFKTFTLDPNRGLVPVNYIPESFTNIYLLNIGQSSTTLDVNAAKNLIVGMVTNEYFYENQGTVDQVEIVSFDLSINNGTLYYDYQNGTHPNNASYASYNGYKSSQTDRTANVPNGWYGLHFGEMGAYRKPPQNYVDYEYYLYYISGGKVTQTQKITVRLS